MRSLKVSLLPGVAAGLVSWMMSSLALGAPPTESREDIVCRARTGVGFLYYYGEGCWCGKGGCQPDINDDCPKGTCTGDCSTKCTHSNGKYGADCSGYVAKVWQVPNPVDLGKCKFHPYGARDFRTARDYWTVTSDLSSLEPGDAAAKNGHVLFYSLARANWRRESHFSTYLVHLPNVLKTKESIPDETEYSDTDDNGWPISGVILCMFLRRRKFAYARCSNT